MSPALESSDISSPRLTAHAQSVREEITGIRHQRNDTALDVRIQRQIRMLEPERAHEPENDAERHGDGE